MPTQTNPLLGGKSFLEGENEILQKHQQQAELEIIEELQEALESPELLATLKQYGGSLANCFGMDLYQRLLREKFNDFAQQAMQMREDGLVDQAYKQAGIRIIIGCALNIMFAFSLIYVNVCNFSQSQYEHLL